MFSEKKALPRQRLDERLLSIKPVSRYSPPPKGWIRAIRDVLGMSGAQLGRRMGVKAQSVSSIEKSEASETIRLNTLRRTAEALDCVVVYAFIPKSSLEEMVQKRAGEIARKEIEWLTHTMELKAQGLSEEDREKMIEIYIQDNLRERDLWEDA